jgi:hypothetical protein
MSNSTDALTGKNYAIMRVDRIRDLAEMRRIEQHNTREKLSENVEPGGPPPRELLPDAHPDTVAGARARMDELGLDLAKLKGAVGVEVILTTSHAWWETATEQIKEDWVDANLAWLAKKFGRALLSAKLHEDEKTPHIHAVALSAVSKVDSVRGPKPKTDEGWARRRAEEEKRKARWRWNYRDLFGQDFEHLSREQDGYHAAVAHLGLDRGERRREVTEVVLENGVVVPAAQVSRGKRRDGSDRPRRTVTTQQYQAAARDDRARAADERRQAEAERQAAALATRRAGEERETAARAARQADDDRRAAAVERAEVRKQRLDQDGAIARQQHEVDSLRAAAIADRDAAARHREDLDDARAVMIASRDRATADAAVADRKRRDAEAAEAATIAERETIAATRRNLDERRRIEVAQLALLARAADDRTGLDLRLVGDSFAIGPNGLTEEDHAAKAKGWSRPLMAMARSLAQALDRIRTLARDLAQRERAAERQAADLEARDAQLAQDRATHDARVAAHQSAIADLDHRRTALDADEARVVTSAAAAVAARDAALVTQASADAILQDHRRWIEVVDVLEAQPRWVEVGADGTLLLDRYAAAASPQLAKAFESRPPDWVVSLAVQRLDLADALQRAEERERSATYAVERMTNMLAIAGPVLTPTQQPVADDARRLLRQFVQKRDDPGR